MTTGAREIVAIFAEVTVKSTESVARPSDAVMVTDPGASPTTKPLPAPMLTALGSDTDQLALCVISRVPPSLNVPIAVI